MGKFFKCILFASAARMAQAFGRDKGSGGDASSGDYGGRKMCELMTWDPTAAECAMYVTEHGCDKRYGAVCSVGTAVHEDALLSEGCPAACPSCPNSQYARCGGASEDKWNENMCCSSGLKCECSNDLWCQCNLATGNESGRKMCELMTWDPTAAECAMYVLKHGCDQSYREACPDGTAAIQTLNALLSEGCPAECTRSGGDANSGESGVYQAFQNHSELSNAVNALKDGATTPYGPIADWDTSRVQSMYEMFYEASDFNGAVGNWDTGQVTTMYRMFYGAMKFDGAVGNWDTGQVTTMRYMFFQATSFNQTLAFDTSKVTNMDSMFSEATSFNQPLPSFDTSKVTNMHYMFHAATSFDQPLASFDTGQVTDMRYMFFGAVSFNQVVTFNMSAIIYKNADMFEGSSGRSDEV